MEPNRLPPGQRLLSNPLNFPVLDLGVQPQYDESYRLEIGGLVGKPASLTLDEVKNLPATELSADFHCVTRWSKFDVEWKGVAWSEIEKLVTPDVSAKFVIQYGLDGYTTNLPIEELRKPNVILAYELMGKPLPLKHGAPLRMIVPHLYGWKGSKFLTGIEFMAQDAPGFWEVRGYHNHGDPFAEERYS
jgi:DMSO/TMAO reductase YedYZ molybdopterin-dependent catalytic subunit